jgi:integrase
MQKKTRKNQYSKSVAKSKAAAKCIKTQWYTKTVRALQLAGRGNTTQHMYARSVRQLIEFYGKEPNEITEQELEDYFLHRRNEDEWAPSTLKICNCGIKFFYLNVLKRDWHIFKILKAQPEKRLPCVLSREELFRILSKVKTFHNYAYLFTVYSLGLRLQEGLYLQVSDIDGERMQVHVHRGKGAKDRFVPLPEDTYSLLRKYWVTHRNPTLLFPALGRGRKNGHSATSPMAIDSVQGALRRARAEAGIKKRSVTIHTLRHSCATHLLDSASSGSRGQYSIYSAIPRTFTPGNHNGLSSPDEKRPGRRLRHYQPNHEGEKK